MNEYGLKTSQCTHRLSLTLCNDSVSTADVILYSVGIDLEGGGCGLF